MILYPHCKINLGLYVRSKRADGYHNIHSLFYPVQLCDALEVIDADESKAPELLFSGFPVPGIIEQNLVYKAWKIMHEQHGVPALKIFLHKAIPMGAGLGGGSSDGAFMLRLLNEKFELNLSQTTLMDYAAKLGSDCPFFIQDRPMLVSGRGEVMEKVEFSLAGDYIKIIHPAIHVSTAEAYSMISPDDNIPDLLQVLSDKTQWRTSLRNDFEKPISNKYPLIDQLIAQSYSEGAYYAAMSGSGSAVFGLYQEKPSPENELFCHVSQLI